MSEEFNKLGQDIFGRGWQTKLAAHTGYGFRQVHNMAHGKAEVPELMMKYLRLTSYCGYYIINDIPQQF